MSDTTVTPSADPAPAPAEPPVTATPPAADPAPAPAASATPPAPVSFELKPVEGLDLAADVMGKYSDVAKELGVSQEAAQKILETVGPEIKASQARALESMGAEWEKQVFADKELGGDKLAENLAVAKKAVDKFATPELKALLDSTRLGNHPEVIRLFHKLGTKISEDKFVGAGAQRAPGDTRTIAQRLYPSAHNQ